MCSAYVAGPAIRRSNDRVVVCRVKLPHYLKTPNAEGELLHPPRVDNQIFESHLMKWQFRESCLYFLREEMRLGPVVEALFIRGQGHRKTREAHFDVRFVAEDLMDMFEMPRDSGERAQLIQRSSARRYCFGRY